MKSCLIVRGEMGSGKTFTSIRLQKKLNVKIVHFDSVINFISEYTRLVFEYKMDDTSFFSSTLLFPTNRDLENFRTDIQKLISENFDFFKTLYENSIKGTISNHYFRKYGGDKSKLIGLGNIGESLEKFSTKIFQLVKKHIIKNSDFFILEGYYFGSNDYLKNVKNSCNNVSILNCGYDKETNEESYLYKNHKFSSISELEKKMVEDFGKFGRRKNSEIKTNDSVLGRSKEVIKKQGFRSFLKQATQKIKQSKFSVVEEPKKFKQLTDKQRQEIKILNRNNKNDSSRKSKKQYQVFSEAEVGMSKSSVKLKELGIPNDLRGKTVLDMGCNEGFFCFECEKRGAKVIGMDNEEYWIEKANERRNQLSSFVCFIQDSWNSLQNLNYKFDLVLFLSAFHYTNNKQLEVLKKIYDKMNERGLLIIELGLSEKNEGEYFIEKIKRPLGDTPQYPNKFTIKELLKQAGFKNIMLVGEVDDIRDVVPRYVFHATK